MNELLAYIEKVKEEADDSYAEWMADPDGFNIAWHLGKMHGQIDMIAFHAETAKRKMSL